LTGPNKVLLVLGRRTGAHREDCFTCSNICCLATSVILTYCSFLAWLYIDVTDVTLTNLR